MFSLQLNEHCFEGLETLLLTLVRQGQESVPKKGISITAYFDEKEFFYSFVRASIFSGIIRSLCNGKVYYYAKPLKESRNLVQYQYYIIIIQMRIAPALMMMMKIN